MRVPRWWFLTFEGSNKGHDYPFCMKVTNLHLDGTMRLKGCCVHVQSKSALQWALHIKCDIAKTYLFQCTCISQVPDHNYRRVIILGRCHESYSLFRWGVQDKCTTNTTHVAGMARKITYAPPTTSTNDANLTCCAIRQGHYFTLIAQIPNDDVPCTAGWHKDMLHLSITWYGCDLV